MICIFDLDGTLVDTVELHADTFVQAFKERGKDVSRARVKELVGLSGPEIVEELGGNEPQEIFRRKVEIFLERVDEVEEMPHATEVLEGLKSQGHRVCIATSSSRNMAEALLQGRGWAVDMMVTADDVERGKPEPDMLEAILGRFDGEAVFVGDTEYDRETARRAGVDALILGEDIRDLREVLAKTQI